jgi:anti-sigma factor RsiW
MSSTDRPDPDMSCPELIERITAYLDDVLPADERAELEEHLQGCPGCRTVLGQWRTVIDLAGRLTEADVDDTDERTRDRLLSTFRDLRRR